jgi:Zn-dependent protease
MSQDGIIWRVATWLIPLIIAIVFHEVAHGYVARMLGDQTAHRLGRLSLNPIRHVDPLGTVIMPMVLAIAHAPIFGWAKPVPVISAHMRHPKLDMALVAMAGPATNLLLGLFAAIAMGVFLKALGTVPAVDTSAAFLLDNLGNFLQINVFLAIFNMLPLPPFDGGHVAVAVLPPPLAARYAQLGRYGFLILFVLLVILPTISPGANVVARIIGPVANGVMRLFVGIARALL